MSKIAGSGDIEAQTFNCLASLLVDNPPLADDRHHTLNTRHIACGTVGLLECFPDSE
jgi:hypothetical protein